MHLWSVLLIFVSYTSIYLTRKFYKIFLLPSELILDCFSHVFMALYLRICSHTFISLLL